MFADDNNIQMEGESDCEDDESVDANAPTQLTPYNSVMSFGRQVIRCWNKGKKRIEQEYAIAGWALCIIEDVRIDVLE